MGQIVDIFVVDGQQSKSLVLRIQKYQKVFIMDNDDMHGSEILFPLNQFPVERTSETATVFVDENALIRKISPSVHKFIESRVNSIMCDLFSIWPEHV